MIGQGPLLYRKEFIWISDLRIPRLKIIASILLIVPSAYALTPYSTQELDDLEKEFIQQINQSESVERDPLANQYINHLGQRLAQAAHLPSPHFFLVKSNEINAFAGPGGHIGVNTALIMATNSESELAAVMAHELAHVRLHHLYRLIQHEKQMRIPMLASILAAAALSVVNPTLGSGALMASLTGFAQDNINFTRSNEKEADRIGMAMLIDSGLNPRAMASFFMKMQQQSRYYYTANVPAILRTHPLDEDRIAEAENRTAHFSKKEYHNSLDYLLFREIMRNTSENNKGLVEYYQLCLSKTQASSCYYGYAITLLRLNQFDKALAYLEPLLAQDPGNLFYQLAMSQAQIGLKHYDQANQKLQELQKAYPDNYAVLMTYARALQSSGHFSEASAVLIKGFRRFNQNLPLCELLAQTEAQEHKKAYAYFTQGQCYLLQGLNREALRQLKSAKQLAEKDPYLSARTDALIEEIKFHMS